MAKVFYVGGAATTPKTYTFTVTGTPTASGNSVVTINSKTVTVVAASTGETVATLMPRLVTALKAAGVPGEFKLGQWASTATTLNFVGPSDGRDVTVSLTVAGATVSAANNTASSPYDLSNTANWSGGALPGNSDEAIFDRDVPVRYGLSALNTVTCTVTRTPNHKSDIGLPDVNPLGFGEYLPTKLACSGATWNINDAGSGTVRLSAYVPTTLTFNAAGGNKILTNISSTAGLVVGMEVSGTGIAAGSTIASIDSSTQITLTSASNVTAGTGVALSLIRAVSCRVTGTGVSGGPFIEATGPQAAWAFSVVGGSLSVVSGSSSTFICSNANISVPYLLAASTVELNKTVARVALTVSTSAVITNGSTVTFLAGSSFGSGDTLTLLSGSTVYWNSTGASGVHTVGSNSTFDASSAPGAFVVESSTVSASATYNDPYKQITLPVVFTLDSCTPTDVRLNLGNVSTIEVN